jgi:regulator of protease activity HflC (stomatin/prohibitin superfamily)
MADEIWKYLGGTFGVVAIILVLLIIVGGFYNVPPGHVGVKFNKMGADKGFNYDELPQGFGLKIPFVQSVWDMPFQTQTIGFYGATEERGTYGAIAPKDKNGIDFHVDVTVRYRIDPNQAAEFMEQKGKGVAAMDQLLATAARADSTRGVFGKYAQEDVPKNRIEIANEIRMVLQERIDQEASRKLKEGFITIEAVDVRNVQFNAKIEERIIAKQIKLQEAQELDYQMEIANKTREIELVNADRDKQAAILRADGEAQSIKLVAFAKAEGIQKVNDAYQRMPDAYVATKFAEAIKQTDKVYLGFESLSGGMLPILDVNQVMGSSRYYQQPQTAPETGSGGTA